MTDQNMPWTEARLSQEMMDYLWDSINQSDEEVNVAENISTHKAISDKNNWFYENELKELTEYLYYKDWNNYYDVHVSKSIPPPVFKLDMLWVNFQKQYEFLPPHHHSALYSFVVFMKIPTHWKEQHKTKFSAHVTGEQLSTRYSNPLSNWASDFKFTLPYAPAGEGNIPLSPEDEGRMLFFPAWLIHQVFPFYGTEEERVTISGNINLVVN